MHWSLDCVFLPSLVLGYNFMLISVFMMTRFFPLFRAKLFTRKLGSQEISNFIPPWRRYSPNNTYVCLFLNFQCILHIFTVKQLLSIQKEVITRGRHCQNAWYLGFNELVNSRTSDLVQILCDKTWETFLGVQSNMKPFSSQKTGFFQNSHNVL